MKIKRLAPKLFTNPLLSGTLVSLSLSFCITAVKAADSNFDSNLASNLASIDQSLIQKLDNQILIEDEMESELDAELDDSLGFDNNLSNKYIQLADNSNLNFDDKNITPEQMELLKKIAAKQLAQSNIKQNPEDKKKSVEAQKRDDAFQALLQDVLPLSPTQIKQLHKFYDMTLQARATPPQAPPTPHFTSAKVSLEPGTTPPVIRLAAGFVTSLVFLDATGSPWPLTAYSLGDPDNFNIQWDQKTHAIFVQSTKQYAHGNLAIRLHGLATPLMLTLVSGQKEVDFRVDLQVDGRGPDAKSPISSESITDSNVNPELLNMLDGVPPKGSIKLGVSGRHGDAWLFENRLYFRTKLTVLSPAWTGKVSSADGTHVYEMMVTPTILATMNGKTIDIKLNGL